MTDYRHAYTEENGICDEGTGIPQTRLHGTEAMLRLGKLSWSISLVHTKQSLYSNKQTPNISLLPPSHINLFVSTTTQILAMAYFVKNLPGLMIGG